MNFPFKHYFKLTLLFSVLWSGFLSAENIVVTVKPIHSIVQNILGETADAVLLIDKSVSAHNYQLRPSDIKTLNQAQVIVYVDNAFESFMTKVSRSIKKEIPVIALSQLKTIKALPPRELNLDHSDSHNHSESHDPHMGQIDPHLWLNPLNARAIAESLTQTFSMIFPENKHHYENNLKHTIEKISQLDSKLTQQLSPLENAAFIVQHDAYQYFESHYHLTAVGTLALDASIPPSVKLAQHIHKTIKNKNVECIFYEPQYSARLVKSIAADAGIRTNSLDPMGVDLKPGVTLYFDLMKNLADDFEKCLQQAP